MAIKDFVYKVISKDGKEIGSAFLIDQGFLMTCGHVVSEAIHNDSTLKVAENTKVLVIGIGIGRAPVDATVRFHEPLSSLRLLRKFVTLRSSNSTTPTLPLVRLVGIWTTSRRTFRFKPLDFPTASRTGFTPRAC